MILLILVVQISLGLCQPVNKSESSEDYLRTVMLELHRLKARPLNVRVYPNELQYLAGKRYSATMPTSVQNPRKVADSEMSSSNHYPQITAPIVVPDPPKVVHEPLAFTKNQLAAMYNQALQSGNALSASALTDALSSGQLPSILGNHLQFPGQMYKFHFFPLKSFVNSLQNNHGYKTINDEPIGAYQESNKQIVLNPLFMAVSGFMGMAVLFMISVLVLPRIFGEFKSRLVHDELLDLTKSVGDAIVHFNSTANITREIVGVKTRPGPNAIVRRRRKSQGKRKRN